MSAEPARNGRYVRTSVILAIAGSVILLLVAALGTLGWADREQIKQTAEEARQRALTEMERNGAQDVAIAVMRQKFEDIDRRLEVQNRMLEELLKRVRR